MALNTFKTLPLLPRVPLTPTIDMAPEWRIFFEQLQPLLGNIAGLDWQVIDKSNARLDEIGERKHAMLQEVEGSGTLHVSQSDVDRWDNLGGSNILTWLIGG